MGFPPDVFEPREKENRPGIVYDADKKSNFYVEDIQAIENEVIDIEDYLLTEPWGGGSGDVTGPAGATADDIVLFNGSTGKIIKDSNKKISDLEPALGFTPEDVANKETEMTDSDDYYPTSKAVLTELSSSFSFLGVRALNPTFPKANAGGLALGYTDLYTVPAGRKAVLLTENVFRNSTGASVKHSFQLKRGGNYYRLSNSTTSSTNTATTVVMHNPFILEAGDTLAIRIETNAGGNIFPNLVEFDDSVPVKTAILTSLANGDNTLYTCPAGKNAIFIRSLTTEVAYISASNDSGGTRTYVPFLVPSGGAAGDDNKTNTATTTANTATGNFRISGCLEAGDFIVINTNSADDTQVAWVTVIEI